jgi:hypothetical protein
MTGFMMYMSGNGLQIFSIMMVVMAFKNPLMGLLATNSTFQRFESEGTAQKLLLVKAAYVAMQIASFGLGIWKVNQMGLLPYVLCSMGIAGKVGIHELTRLAGQRGQIGLHGRARGNRWSTPYQRFNRCIILCQNFTYLFVRSDLTALVILYTLMLCAEFILNHHISDESEDEM